MDDTDLTCSADLTELEVNIVGSEGGKVTG